MNRLVQLVAEVVRHVTEPRFTAFACAKGTHAGGVRTLRARAKAVKRGNFRLYVNEIIYLFEKRQQQFHTLNSGFNFHFKILVYNFTSTVQIN